MDGDTGNLFHTHIDNYGDANGEHLVRNRYKGPEEKTHNDFSCIVREGKNIYDTDIIYLSPKFHMKSDVKLPEKIARVQKRRIRKSSVDFKILQNKISAYSVINKCKIREKFPALNHTSALNIHELCNKPNNDVKVLYERETEQRGRKNHAKLNDSDTRDTKKSQSSDLFGFQRCMQRKRNIHYNLNVIYKFLRKDGKLKDHNVLRCKHYSFEDINQKKCKKIASVIKFESDIPTHYNLVDFTQCSSVSNIYLLKPKDINQGESIKKCNKHQSTMKVNKRRLILNKSDSQDSANTQTLQIKSKQKKVSTCTCPSSKLFSWRTTAVNICQPSRWLCKHLKPPLGLESDVSNKQTVSNKVSPEPLNVFKAAFKYFLCAIAIIIWLPCILVMGLLWLISYPLRPHQDAKYTENTRKKNKRNNTKLSKIFCKCKKNKQKSKRNKRKGKGKDSLTNDKLQQKSSKLSRKKISRNSKRKYNKRHGKWSKKSPGDMKKTLKKSKKYGEKKNMKTLGKSKTGFTLSGRTTKITAFPSEVSRRSKDKKKQKNVTFKQPIEKAFDKKPSKKIKKKQCLCSESLRSRNLKDDKYKTQQLKELKRNEKKLRSYKIDPSECQQLMLKKHRTAKSKRKKIRVCVPKTLSKLLQILRHTCSTTNDIANFQKRSKVKRCSKTNILPECVELMKSQNFDTLKKKNRRKKCKSYCCIKGCSGARLPKSSNKSEFSPKSSVIHKENPKKNVKVATKKSNSIVKFFPSPRKQIQQPSPVIKYFPSTNQQSNSKILPVKEDHKSGSSGGDTKPIHQASLEIKSHTTRDKKVTKKGSKVKPTTIVKFFRPPSSPKDECETDGTEEVLPKSSSKTKGLTTSRLPAHTTSTNTDPANLTPTRKIFYTPRKKTQTVSSSTSIPETSSQNNPVKSFRRNTSSKASVTNPRTRTSVIKFLPVCCPRKCSAASNTSAQKPRGSGSERAKTTTVVKFFPPPQQRQINTAINTTESKASPLKIFLTSLRCSKRTRSIGSDAHLEKRTSVFKFLPPLRHETRTLAVNAVKTPSVLSNVSTQSHPRDKIPGDRFQAKPPSNKKNLMSSQNSKITSSSNMDKAPKNTLSTPPPSQLSKKRSRGVTTKRPSQVVKFFPKQQYNTRSFAVSARPSDKSNERIRTANKPVSTPKGNISVIKFYPHPHIGTQTIGTNTFLRTFDKKCDASKLTNIIKFYPSPKKATTNRGTVPLKFKNQNLGKLQPGTNSQASKTDVNKKEVQPCFTRFANGLRKLTECQTMRILGRPTKASSTDKLSSDAQTLAGGKVKQKSRLVQSPCQPDCKGVQVNTKSLFDTKVFQIQNRNNVSGGIKGKVFQTMRGDQRETRKDPRETRKDPRDTRKDPRETRKDPRETRKDPREIRKDPRETRKDPRETRRDPKETRRDPKETRKDPKETRRNPGERKTAQRGNFGSKYSKLSSSSAKHEERKKRPPGKFKRILANIYKDEEIDCTELMMKSSDRPCAWIYKHWPSAYPAFMVLYKIYNNLIHIFFFFFAACIWCPLFCWCFIFYFFVVKKLFC